MPHIQRAALESVKKLSRMFGAVLVTGARQVGKSTLLERLIDTFDNPTTLTMDDANTLEAATVDPDAFLALNKPPLLLDEIQKVPALFPHIKKQIDKSKGKGLFFMSGSEQFHMMERVTESLAGRVGILTLMGISLREQLAWRAGKKQKTAGKDTSINLTPGGFIPTDEALGIRAQGISELGIDELWKVIHRGSMPELVANPDFDWSMFYGSYVRTYIERDIRKLTQIDDEIQFQTFMRVIASRTGQMLNISDVARDVGIKDAKAKKWLSVLQSSHLVYLLRPFYTNLTKRAVKTPKLYMTDTGLAAYLTRWPNHQVLQEGAMSGALFETFVVGEILKSYYNFGELDPPLYYYRDKDKREIDLIIVRDGRLHPLEIKKSTNPTIGDTKAFKVLDNVSEFSRGSGGVICAAERLLPLSTHDRIIPVTCL
jgi:predicted AAA+ superfamily ATPase